MLLNKARQRLGLVKVEQNNFEEALALFRDLQQDSPDWRHRTYAAHWIQRLSRYAAAKQALLNCGADALAYILEKEGRKDAANTVRMRIPETMRGHSLQSLVNLAAEHAYELVALQVASSEVNRLPLPAILHVIPRHEGDKGHYWVLDKIEGDQSNCSTRNPSAASAKPPPNWPMNGPATSSSSSTTPLLTKRRATERRLPVGLNRNQHPWPLRRRKAESISALQSQTTPPSPPSRSLSLAAGSNSASRTKPSMSIASRRARVPSNRSSSKSATPTPTASPLATTPAST